MPPTPEVLPGLRAPRAVRLEAEMERAAHPESAQVPERPIPAVDPNGPTTYRSGSPGYRVQITSPRVYSDPVTGQKTAAGRMIVAQFVEGIYRNTERDPELRALIDRTLQSNPHFGKFGDAMADYWLLADEKVALEKKKVENALKTLRSLPPEVVQKHLESLKPGDAEDHALPKAKPIPPAE